MRTPSKVSALSVAVLVWVKGRDYACTPVAAAYPSILLQNSFRVLFLIADGAESLSGVSDTDRDADLSGQAGIGLGSADWQTNLASRFRF